MRNKKFHILIMLMMAALHSKGANISENISSGVLTFSETTAWGDKIEISFCKCMANELYTFHNVKLNDNEVNSAKYSDNIGPFLVNGTWIGGNHTLGDTKTARTTNHLIKVDGEIMSENFTTTGQVLSIEVENELIYKDGEKFATETISYNVSGNSIQVECKHRYEHPDNLNIDCYYGMQSMFKNETEILLPGSEYSGWITLDNSAKEDIIRLSKASAPNFSLFVERNDVGYQATYLLPSDLGDHHSISETDFIYIGNSSAKSYHKLIGNHPVSRGEETKWKGLYTWFSKATTDNYHEDNLNGNFEYGAYIEGQPINIDINSNGEITRTDAKLNDITIDPHENGVTINGNTVTFHKHAMCIDLAGKTIYSGIGSFTCNPGLYIIRYHDGHKRKIIIR